MVCTHCIECGDLLLSMNVMHKKDDAADLAIGKFRSLQVALCGLLAGLLLGCCFPPIDMTVVAWFALVPLGVVLVEKRLTSQSWTGVYLGGLVYHLLAMQWINELEAEVSLLSVWLVLSQLGALIFCLSMLVARRVVAHFNLPGCIAIPLFWVGFECLRMPVASAIDPAAVSWLRLGGTQVEWTLIAQIANFGGETTLSALVALVNGWLFQFLSFAVDWKSGAAVRFPKSALVAPPVLIAAAAYGWWCLSTFTPSTGPTVALLDRQEWLQNRERVWNDDEKPELMVWPELADHHKFVTGLVFSPQKRLPEDVELLSQTVAGEYSIWYRERLALAAAQADAAVLMGCERIDLSEETPRRYNSVVYANSKRGFIGFSDKQYLAPLYEGELSVASWLGISGDNRYWPGPVSSLFSLPTPNGEKKFACVVCNDISSPACMKAKSKGGVVDFFVHCGSEATDQTGVVSKTLLRMARLRAIEARRPIVRNCHRGACGVIDSLGRFTPCQVVEGRFAPITIPLNSSLEPSAVLEKTSFASGKSLLLIASIMPVAWLTRRTKGPDVKTANASASSRVAKRQPNRRSPGFSLLELLAVVAILGTIAAIILPRVTVTGATAKEKADAQNRAIINSAVERFYIMEGDWPELDLSDIGADPNYFPEGIPSNPVSGNAYELDATTYRVKVGGGGGK